MASLRIQIKVIRNDKMFIDSMNAAMAFGVTGMDVIRYALKRGKAEGFIDFSFKTIKEKRDDRS